MNEDQARWYTEYYNSLIDAKIVNVRVEDLDGELWPTLDVLLADGEVAEVQPSSDEEGNGPGFLLGLPIPR